MSRRNLFIFEISGLQFSTHIDYIFINRNVWEKLADKLIVLPSEITGNGQ